MRSVRIILAAVAALSVGSAFSASADDKDHGHGQTPPRDYKPSHDYQPRQDYKPHHGFKPAYNTNNNTNLNRNYNTNINRNTNNNVNLNSSRARANATANSASVSASQSTSNVNITNSSNSSRGSRTTRLVTPPTVVAASLTAAGIEACLGSVSGGASFMGGGFSFGTTTKDDDCNRRLYARQLHNMGYRGAAVATQCLSPEVAYAMAVAGTPCAGPAPVVAQGPAVVSAYAGMSPSPTDTTAAPDGFKWMPNPEYAAWEREQEQPRRARR